MLLLCQKNHQIHFVKKKLKKMVQGKSTTEEVTFA